MSAHPNPRRPRQRVDDGSAPIEFIFASVVLLIPLVYLVIALSHVQAGAYAAHAIAVDAATAAARSPERADAHIPAIAEMHTDDLGIPGAVPSITTRCAGACDRPGSLITADVDVAVPVPGLPLIFGASQTPTISVRASQTEVVEP